MDPVIFASACLLLAAATVTDLRAQRIPNALTIPAALAALTLHTLSQGPAGLWLGVQGLGLGLGLMLAPFLFGVMGGGDVKLMAALGALFGPALAFEAFLAASLAGGLYALIVLAARGDVIRAVFRRFWTALCVGAGTGNFDYQPAPAAQGLPRLCYGLAIALGAMAVMAHAVFLHGWTRPLVLG